MSIPPDDVKIRASQNMTDEEDGGGFMIAEEIVDGAMNQVFPDISRLDRALGRVSMRKIYVHVDTANTDTYYGAHLILAEQAKDPNVSITLFSTGSDSDQRKDARDRLESYVTIGPKFVGWLWGPQPQGARQLLLFQPLSGDTPKVNDVLCLYKEKDTANEFSQYVRITGVEEEEKEFTLGETTVVRKVLTLQIGDPLEETFEGVEMHKDDATETNVYTTTASNSAEYFGVMQPTADIEAGATAVNVDSVYAQLVPTSQAESPYLDLSPGDTVLESPPDSLQR